MTWRYSKMVQRLTGMKVALYVYWDISHLLEHYDQFRLDQIEPFEEALLDYPVLEKYRSVLCSETAEDPY